jgi:PTH1 family peptidyl-tRNA hydrolase
VATVVVGLGNPGTEYEATRHNVGQRVLDRLAETFHRRWQREGRTMVSRGQWRGIPVHLVKPVSFMNVSGPVVADALRRSEADPSDLILVYDDIDLPLGTVRVRMRGSHGGHNGARSVIEALGTEEIRRVKVGVGRPEHKSAVPDHVLAPFDAAETEMVETAVATAAERVLDLLGKTARA